MIEERQVDGFSALTLADPAAGELDATFVPEAGMVACSLRHRGEELLGQRGGLRKYVEERMTMGIPLLHPWANRVALRRFEVAGREVDLDRVPERLRHDSNGLPMHGLLSGIGGWRVRDAEEGASGAVLAAAFDFDAGEGLTGAFPFPHQVLVEARLSVDTLTISTTVLASRDSRVPIAFGYHPYLRLPEIERAGWEIEVPVSERLALDDHGLPTGAREPTAAIDGPLGAWTFDDL
jgi:aldose 1-epimerase